MRVRLRPALFAASALAAVVLLVLAHRAAVVGAGVKAKAVCSGVFVSGRAADAVEREDLAAYRSAILDAIRVKVDGRGVRASALGLPLAGAVYRPGLGCTLLAGADAASLPAARSFAPGGSRELPLAEADRSARREALEAVVAGAFDDPHPDRPRRTRAVVVLEHGRIIVERYAEGFSADTPLPGWSMTKSVVSALVGILVAEGKIALDQPAPVAEWGEADDPRRRITWGDLLAMSSGLAFAEDYANPLADVMVMLFASRDAGGVAAGARLESPPGTRWQYSSGSTNILARAMRSVFPGGEEYLAFPRRALFDRLGMASAVIEPDAAGSFVGSSFMFATARDWARFGDLYRSDGSVAGERLLPEGWVAASMAPVPAAPDGRYGRHWWLKLDGPDGRPAAPPEPTLHAAGHGGQYVTVVPGRGLVIVRLGLAIGKGAWDQTAFVRDVIGALDPAPAR